MKRSKMIPLLLVLGFILGFYGVAFSVGGGFEGSGCPVTLPAPTSGPFLYGTFTVARDKITLGWGEFYDHYDVHVVLQHGLDKHLYSFPVPAAPGTDNLCSYKASDIEQTFAKAPCTEIDASGDFGLTGVPVIYDLYIAKKDFCDTNDEMIFGLITIRVVPPVPPKPPKPPWR